MNGLDYAIIALVAAGAIYGVSRGALRMLTSLASVACGIYFASVYYAALATIIQPHLGLSSAASAVVAYIALFVVVFSAIEYFGRFLMRLVNTVHLTWVDRLAGSALGAATMSVIVGLGLMMLTALLPSNAALLQDSRLAPKLLAYNEELVTYLPDEVKRAYLAKRAEFAHLWKQHAPPAVTEGSPSPTPVSSY